MTQINSTQKSMGYDNPAYVTRQSFQLGTLTAGASGQSSKCVAHANLVAYSISAYTNVVGTSTYTYTGPNGSSTIGIAAQQLSLIVVSNTASVGSSVSLSTTTYGPYVLGGQFGAAGTFTNQVGAFSQAQLNTNTGTAGLGGIVIPQGSYFYVVSGTDATATETVEVDYQIQPLAAVPA
jgi:hypothetical protein